MKEELYSNTVLYFTWYKNKYSSNSNSDVIHSNDSWDSIVECLLDKCKWPSFNASNIDEYKKEKDFFDGIIFAEMMEGKPRTQENVIKYYAIVLDIDGDASIQDVQNDLKEYEYLLYSTGSQGLKGKDRFRVVLPLLEAVDRDEYNSYSKGLSCRFNYSDPSFCKSLQIQYLPRINKKYSSQFVSTHNKGIFFDITILEKKQAIDNNFSIDVFNAHKSGTSYEVKNKSKISELIVSHNNNNFFDYNEKLKLASCLKSSGYQEDDIAGIIEKVSKPDATNSGTDMYQKAHSSYGSILGLRKFLPEKTQILLNTNHISHDNSVIYDYEIQLDEEQYLSDVIDKIEFKKGINLLIASTGIGKNYAMGHRKNTKVVTPLVSIVQQAGSNNDIYKDNIATWNQLKTMMNSPEECKNWDLVIDEAHGIIFDYDYKHEVIDILNEAIKLFNKVIFMSGTIKPNYFCHRKFETVSKVTKKDKAVKQIQTYFCKSKESSIIRDLKCSYRKSILLINDKAKGEYIGRESGKKYLLVNADVKSTQNVKDLFSTGTMNDYDCIIGTNSIVEGLSIIDDLDEVDIFICEETEPDRIEQFSNRFRNIKKMKNVNYYVETKKIMKTIDNNIEKAIESAKKQASSLKECFDNVQNNQQKNSFYEHYSIGNLLGVYIKNDDFYVDYNIIDYNSYLNRKEKASNEFNYFMSRLFEYNFQIFLPIYDDYSTDTNVNNKISENKKVEKKSKLQKENNELNELNEYFKLGKEPEFKGFTFSKYKIIIEQMKLGGLKDSDIPHVIDSIIKDRSYKDKVLKDIENNKAECKYRQFVISEVQKCLFSYLKDNSLSSYISSDNIQKIAIEVVKIVLVDEFNNNVDLMLNSPDWKSLISKKVSNGNNVTLNTSAAPLDTFFIKNKMASRIIKKYISIENSTKVTKSKKRITVYKIQHFSLSGLAFNN
ncbi:MULTISPECIES: hypothetical protein [unclassified Providencia]|uniref:hypothetical protein n=1 Tax=unclassified Providencia TaxID=2633465 RepID=UPI001407ABFD|nr:MULTISPECIES: hypothetical protein [unclassified Providencia]ELR5136046.1 hypothetical protein [Providencia rettgeri]